MLRAAADWTLLPDSYAGWARRARAAAARRLARGDVRALLTSSPPDSVHLAGLALARAGARPWIADFRDPWIGAHFRRPPTPWHASRQRAAERAVVAGADLVLAASATHAGDLRAMRTADGTPLARRVEHLPNGFEPVAGDGVAPDPAPGTFAMVFTGTLSLMPDTRLFLAALARFLARRPDARDRVHVRLAGPYDVDDEDRARTLGLADVVRFPGPLDRAATRALQRRADLLLLWKPHGPGYRTMVPGKLYEYLDSGRPVLALLDPRDEAGALAARGGAELVAPGDVDRLAATLEHRFDTWARDGRAPDARPAWLADHARAALAGRLATLLDDVTEARP
jgi:glycosyltransferase involved in cell wall biosynthesis